MKNRKTMALAFLQLYSVEHEYPVLYWEALLGKIVFCDQINLRNTDIDSSLPQGFSEPLICLCTEWRESQDNISKMGHLLISAGTQEDRKPSPGSAVPLPNPAHTPWSKSIFKSHFPDSQNEVLL